MTSATELFLLPVLLFAGCAEEEAEEPPVVAPEAEADVDSAATVEEVAEEPGETWESDVDLFRCQSNLPMPGEQARIAATFDRAVRPEEAYGLLQHFPGSTLRGFELVADGGLGSASVSCRIHTRDGWVFRIPSAQRNSRSLSGPAWGLNDGEVQMRLDVMRDAPSSLATYLAEGADIVIRQVLSVRVGRWDWLRTSVSGFCGLVDVTSPFASFRFDDASATRIHVDIGSGDWPEPRSVDDFIRDQYRGHIDVELRPDAPLHGVSRLKTDRSVYLQVPTSVPSWIMVPAGVRLLCAGSTTRSEHCGKLGPLTVGVGPQEERAVIQVEAGWGAVVLVPAPWEGPCRNEAHPSGVPRATVLLNYPEKVTWATPPAECGDLFDERCPEAWSRAYAAAFEQATGKGYGEYLREYEEDERRIMEQRFHKEMPAPP